MGLQQDNLTKDEQLAAMQRTNQAQGEQLETLQQDNQELQQMVELLQQQNADEGKLRAFAEKMQGWIDADLGDIIVMAMTVEATDRRISGPVEQALRSATSETLKGKVYLERDDGKRLDIIQYEQPTADQTGAKFVFTRSLDGKPFITPETEGVRFVAEFNDKLKVNRRYKIAEMMYNGKLEY